MIISGARPSKPSFLEVTQASSGTQETATKGAVPGTESRSLADHEIIDPNAGMPISQIVPDAESLHPGIALVLPKGTFQPAIPTTKISVKHDPQQTVKAYLNGISVSSFNFDTMSQNAARTVAVSTWMGVDLADGDNEIDQVVF